MSTEPNVPAEFRPASVAKFSSDIAEWLYEQDCDDSTGTVDELGWFGLVTADSGGWIVSVDSAGFVDSEWFGLDSLLAARWLEIQTAYAEFDSEDES